LKKLDAARDGLGHTIPGATAEQVLEAALDLLLEKQARARGLVQKPRTVVATAPLASPLTPTIPATTTAAPNLALALAPAVATAATEASVPNFTKPRHRRTEPRKHVPAAIFRAVWKRDGGRCSWPLDSGGACGSTHRLELDHVVPWARWGGETVDDLRVVCHAHKRS
jgi:5-methylcytosine-specific restriction endonuclease McrA